MRRFSRISIERSRGAVWEMSHFARKVGHFGTFRDGTFRDGTFRDIRDIGGDKAIFRISRWVCRGLLPGEALTDAVLGGAGQAIRRR
jgi:hypothetical protein